MVVIPLVKKRKSLEGKTVIGIDEFNNGFSFSYGLPMIIVSYLIRDFPNRSNIPNAKYEKKRGILSKTPKGEEEFQKRARYYLNQNPNFKYTLLEKNPNSYLMLIERAQAIRSLILANIYDKKLDPLELVIAMDIIDEKGRSQIVAEELDRLLYDDRLSVKFYFQCHGEDHNVAIKKADRAAYYLAGLRKFKPKGKWPHVLKRVPLDFKVIQND